MRTFTLFATLSLSACLLALPAISRAEGIDVGKPSALRNLVPASQLERQSARQYDDLKRQAAAQRALAPDNHPQLKRLRAMAERMIPLVERWNPQARQWRWEVILIGSKQINAFCMPGGKIAFYTGILDTLQLSDDEAAMVMGHEIAHALREHARERLAKSELTQLGASLLGQYVGGGKYYDAFQAGGGLLSLKFSRDDETEADAVGLELAARAGYDPRAGITLWQKMMAANRNGPPSWLSTHPAGKDRIKQMEKHLTQVMPLYQAALAQPGR